MSLPTRQRVPSERFSALTPEQRQDVMASYGLSVASMGGGGGMGSLPGGPLTPAYVPVTAAVSAAHVPVTAAVSVAHVPATHASSSHALPPPPGLSPPTIVSPPPGLNPLATPHAPSLASLGTSHPPFITPEEEATLRQNPLAASALARRKREGMAHLGVNVPFPSQRAVSSSFYDQQMPASAPAHSAFFPAIQIQPPPPGGTPVPPNAQRPSQAGALNAMLHARRQRQVSATQPLQTVPVEVNHSALRKNRRAVSPADANSEGLVISRQPAGPAPENLLPAANFATRLRKKSILKLKNGLVPRMERLTVDV